MFEHDAVDVEQRALTGALPPRSRVAELVAEAHARYVGLDEGAVADYIPVLAAADPARFGLSVVGVDGASHEVGDVGVAFSIQSISKAFVFALVCEELGHEAVHERVGVNNTGLAFNSLIAMELNGGSPMNPMVNAGAIATTALVPAASAEERWDRVRLGCRASRAANSRSTRPSTAPKRRPTIATGRSASCCRATAGSIPILSRPSTSTRGSARSR